MLSMAGLSKLAYTQCLKIIEDESLIAFAMQMAWPSHGFKDHVKWWSCLQ